MSWRARRHSPTPPAQIVFDVSHHPTRIHAVEALRGKSGFLTLTRLVVESYEREEYLLFSGFDDAGASLDQETMEKLFGCSGRVDGDAAIPAAVQQRLNAEAERHAKATVSRSLEQNSVHFNQAREKLEKWADDMVLSAEKALADTKEQIKALRRQARQAVTLEEQHEIQQQDAEAGKAAAPPAAGHLQGRGRDHGEARRPDRIAGKAAVAAAPRPRHSSPFAGRSNRLTQTAINDEQRTTTR